MHNNVLRALILVLGIISGVAVLVIPESPADTSDREVREVTIYIAQVPVGDWQWHRGALLRDSWFGVVEDEYDLQRLLLSRPYLRGRLSGGTDWSSELVVVAALGEAPTGGHAVRIERILSEVPEVRVVTHLRSPHPGDFVTQAITYPVDSVHLRRDLVPPNAQWIFVDQYGRQLTSEGW